MDTKYKDDLFRKYVQFHEGKVDTTPSKQQPGSDEYLRVAAATLLSLHKVDPLHRFRLIRFYEVVESSLRSLSSSSLSALHCAFSMLETVAINLFLFPWKKEFRSIKVRWGGRLCLLFPPECTYPVLIPWAPSSWELVWTKAPVGEGGGVERRFHSRVMGVSRDCPRPDWNCGMFRVCILWWD